MTDPRASNKPTESNFESENGEISIGLPGGFSVDYKSFLTAVPLNVRNITKIYHISR